MKNKWLLPLLVLFIAPLQAKEPPLRVGVTVAGEPIEFRHRNEWQGLEPDLARAFGDYLDRPVEFVELEWEKQIPALISGKTDIIMAGMSVTRLRSLQIAFANPYLKVGQMALIRAEDKEKFPNAPSIIETQGYVGSIEQTTGDFLTNHEFPNAKHRHFNEADDGAKALKKKKIDIFITDGPYVKHYARKNKDLYAVPILLTDENLAWAVKKSNKALLESANAFLEELKTSGRLDEILSEWGL